MASKTVKASIIIGGSMSGAFRAALSQTKNGFKGIGEEIAKVERRQRLLGSSINTFGRMGRDVSRMRQEYGLLAREADNLRRAQGSLANLNERMEANRSRRRELAGRIGGAVATTGALIGATMLPIRTATEFESAMLGVAKQLEGARDEGGKLTPVYHGMARQIQQLGREVPMATNELADMVAAGLRMGVASDQVVQFTRVGAMMADAFSLPAGQLANDMGQIAGLFKIPVPRIGELADAINFLDDNAQSSGADIIDVLRRVGGMATALKMPAKEAAALGSTFLTLGSSAEVAGTASNAVLRILGAATAQSKRVRNGLTSIGMKPEDVQASMAKDPTGTILRLLQTLNKLNDEQRMVAATRIFGAEYGDDIAKLATGAEEYRRQLALVNDAQSRGSVAREFQARLQTVGAQWQLTKNRMSEVAVTIGNALVPAVHDLMKTMAPMAESFAGFAREHPGAVRGIVGMALGLSVLRIGALGVGYAFAAVKGPLLGTLAFIQKFRAGQAMAALGRFGPFAARTVSVLRTVGVAVAAIGGGPVALLVAALTAGALVIRKYWEPIKAWIGGVASGIVSTAAPAFTELGAALAPLKPVWDGIVSAAGSAFRWFMQLIEPVNATREQLAGATSAGQSFGRAIGSVIGWVVGRITALVTLIGRVRTSIGDVARSAMSIPGLKVMFPSLAGAAAIANAVGGRPVLGAMPPPAKGKPVANWSAPAAGARGATIDQRTTNIHITQQPGESQEALARRIEDERRRREAVASRGSLVDGAT